MFLLTCAQGLKTGKKNRTQVPRLPQERLMGKINELERHAGDGRGGPDSAGGCGMTGGGHLQGTGWHRGVHACHLWPDLCALPRGFFCPICSGWLRGARKALGEGAAAEAMQQKNLRRRDGASSLGMHGMAWLGSASGLSSLRGLSFRLLFPEPAQRRALGFVTRSPRWQQPPVLAVLPAPAPSVPPAPLLTLGTRRVLWTPPLAGGLQPRQKPGERQSALCTSLVHGIQVLGCFLFSARRNTKPGKSTLPNTTPPLPLRFPHPVKCSRPDPASPGVALDPVAQDESRDGLMEAQPGRPTTVPGRVHPCQLHVQRGHGVGTAAAWCRTLCAWLLGRAATSSWKGGGVWGNHRPNEK